MPALAHVPNATFVQICGNGSARPLLSRLTHGRKRPIAHDEDQAARMHAIVGVIFVLAVLLLAPATASARPVEDAFFNSVISSRVDHLIGFTPTTFAIHPSGERVVPIKVRVGGHTYRFVFGNAAAVVGPSPRSAADDPDAALPEPGGGVPGPPAHRPRASLRSGAGGSGPRCRRAGGGSGSPGMWFGRVALGGARDRRGHDSHVVGGRRARAGERGRDRAAPRRHRGRSVGGAALRCRLEAAQGARAAADGGIWEAARGTWRSPR